jgi:hypothetical protein
MEFVLVIVCRPDPASLVTYCFFDDWADVLKRTSAFFGCLIVGGINRHVDDAARFRSLLDSYGLRDYIGRATREDHRQVKPAGP